MNPDLKERLSRLHDDLHAGRVERSALFWLKIFADQASQNAGGVRSDRWVEAGLAEAREIPGLKLAALAPREQLISRYDLFHFIRLKDSLELTGDSLLSLDWQRKYRVSLLPALAAHLPELRSWASQLWAELGGPDPGWAELEQVLARYRQQGSAVLIEALHEAQAIFGGWLPEEVIETVAAALQIPVADVYGVTEFYEMFYTQPVGQSIIRVCQDAPCALAGAV